MYECGVYKYAPRASEKNSALRKCFTICSRSNSNGRAARVVARNIEALAMLQLCVL